jgi:hypothetical protein
MDNIEIVFGHENFGNYKRLAYKWWYALAEFVDNSSQSYDENKDLLDKVLDKEQEPFRVSIMATDDLCRISDNAMGMDLEDLRRSMIVGKPPANIMGRSRYGLGMKTAACWIGDHWKIVTSKLGEPVQYTLEVDVNQIVKGDLSPSINTLNAPADAHYTYIEITKHNRPLRGRTVGKIKDYLRSIYRQDLSSGSMVLSYNDDVLIWEGHSDEEFLTRNDGTIYKKSFIFEIDTTPRKVAEGWVGILKKGSRSRAGFSILHRKRVIKGWPESWRPSKIYGEGGRNDLINQRLVGEINLEDFEVSHTKDEINWYGEEEDKVEAGLEEECRTYMEAARKARKGQAAGHGPQPVQVDAAVRALEEELATPEFMDMLALEDTLPPIDQILANNHQVVENAARSEPSFIVNLGEMTVTVYLDSLGSPNDPYFLYEDKDVGNVVIVINAQHPHWSMLEGENSIVNYLRHCVYDGVAEYRAAKLSRLEPDSVKRLKDSYLRIAFEVIQSEDDSSPEE